MRRSHVTLAQALERDALCAAVWRAARGKRAQPGVQRFLSSVEEQVALLRDDVLGGRWNPGPPTRFQIRDPKPRWIEAPPFRERVLHHALVAVMEPRVEQALSDSSFACRRGKGGLAAVKCVQRRLRRQAWYIQVDVRAYFASINHAVLLGQLGTLFRDQDMLALIQRLLQAHGPKRGQGLPIGALTSQLFANLYLAPLDRYLEQAQGVAGMVRYMDDVVWWLEGSKAPDRKASLQAARDFARRNLGLELHRAKIQRSSNGITYVGYRIHRDRLLATTRRRHRYRRARRHWEHEFQNGEVGSRGLQAGAGAALAILAHTRSRALRRRDLEWRPPIDA